MKLQQKRILIGVIIGLYASIVIFNTGNIIWNADWNANANKIAIVDSYAYIATYDKGLIIVDISNPSMLVRVGHLDPPRSIYDIAIIDNYAMIVADNNALIIADISNPSHPVILNQINGLGSARKIDIANSYAYILHEYGGLSVLDISTPLTPVLVNSTSIFFTSPRDITVIDSLAYVAVSYQCCSSYLGFFIVNVSVPSNPTIITQVSTPSYAHSVAVVGSYAYVTNAYAGLIIFDVSTPSTPVLIGQADTPGYAYDITVKDSYAYVTDLMGGVVVIDISTPSVPVLIYQADTAGYAEAITIVDSFVYIIDDKQGLLVFDVNTASSPKRVINLFYADSISTIILICTNIFPLGFLVPIIRRKSVKNQNISATSIEAWFTQNMSVSPVLSLLAYRSEKADLKVNEKFFIKQITSLGFKYKCSGIWHPSLKGYVFLPYFGKNLSDMINQQGVITLIQWATQLNMSPEDAMIILKALLRNETVPIEFNPQTLVISHRNKTPPAF